MTDTGIMISDQGRGRNRISKCEISRNKHFSKKQNEVLRHLPNYLPTYLLTSRTSYSESSQRNLRRKAAGFNAAKRRWVSGLLADFWYDWYTLWLTKLTYWAGWLHYICRDWSDWCLPRPIPNGASHRRRKKELNKCYFLLSLPSFRTKKRSGRWARFKRAYIYVPCFLPSFHPSLPHLAHPP